MIALSAIVGVLLAIFLLLRIVRMLGGGRTTIKTMHGSFDKDGKFYPGDLGRDAFPPLPARSQQELGKQTASMPVEWVTYLGATPPLKLKIRGTSLEMYRRACRKYIDLIGEENFRRLSPEQAKATTRQINAETYVLDWEGAMYPNGAPMPFIPASLATMLGNDPHLEAFLSNEVERISPKWDVA